MKLTNKISFLNRLRLFHLYHTAFPRSEKKPFKLIRKAQKLGYGQNFAILSDEGRLIGLAFLLCNDEITLLDYFAIVKSVRGRGYGSQALEILKKRFSNAPLVLEIEDPEVPCKNREERLKRADFYHRCGMRSMDFRVSLFGVDMCILTSGEKVSYEQYHNLLYSIFGEHFAENVYLLQ